MAERDPEDLKKYFKIKTKRVVPVRFSTEEQALLFDEMQKEGWENVSGFIKYKLFGLDPARRVKSRISAKDEGFMGILLQRAVLELVDRYDWIIHRYDKDMRVIYNEAKIESAKWVKATNGPHFALMDLTRKLFKTVSDVADALGLEKYFDMPSEEMGDEFDNGVNYMPGSPQFDKFQKYAEQVRKEHIARGLTDGKL